MNNTDKTNVAEMLNASTSPLLVICGTMVAIAALISPNVDNSVKIGFASTGATAYAAAAGLASRPDRSEKKPLSAVGTIGKVEEINIPPNESK